jgi:cytochrome c556
MIIISFSCSSEKKDSSSTEQNKTSQNTINPNGDSELALLMREMYDEAARVKKQVKNGEPVSLTLDYDKILTAHATDQEEAETPEFKAFAQLYLNSLESLKSAQADQVEGIFSQMVESCIACHKTFCPGPLVRIQKLK